MKNFSIEKEAFFKDFINWFYTNLLITLKKNFYRRIDVQGVPERSIRSESAISTVEGALRQKFNSKKKANVLITKNLYQFLADIIRLRQTLLFDSLIWDPIPAPFLWLGLVCHLHGSYKHLCILSHLYPMMYSFFSYIVFFSVMLSFRSMCKSLRDKKSSIQFLVLLSKFNCLKMPIKSIGIKFSAFFLFFVIKRNIQRTKKLIKLQNCFCSFFWNVWNHTTYFYSPSI